MPKGIPNRLLFNSESEIKLRVPEELTYLGASEYTLLILLCTKSLEFLTQEGECWTISV
jgi:DNA-binding winged helix-turn-helix (wHTH) protein